MNGFGFDFDCDCETDVHAEDAVMTMPIEVMM